MDTHGASKSFSFSWLNMFENADDDDDDSNHGDSEYLPVIRLSPWAGQRAMQCEAWLSCLETVIAILLMKATGSVNSGESFHFSFAK